MSIICVINNEYLRRIYELGLYIQHRIPCEWNDECHFKLSENTYSVSIAYGFVHLTSTL